MRCHGPHPPRLAQYLDELTMFPNGRHDDQVDSTVP
jgi:phage terminase large subunit-like protein